MAALLTLFCLPDAALAEYPERPVSLIVNSAPGGIGDAVSRIIAEKLSQKWGQGIVVMNKSGAGGLISTNETLHQPADGYYVYVTDASISTNHVLRLTPGVDPRTAFAPITLIGTFDFKLVVNSQQPLNSVQDLVDFLKKQPGACNYSSPGIGSPHYNIAELFNYYAGVKVVHVAFRGTPAAVLEVATNRITYTFAAFQSAAPLIESGQLRALATTGAKRNDVTPDLPTVGETLKGFAVGSFFAAFVRPEVPEVIRKKIAMDFAAIIKDPAVRKSMLGLGLDPVGGTPAELEGFLDADIKRWQAVPEGTIAKQ